MNNYSSYIGSSCIIIVSSNRNESICKRVYLSIVDIMTNCDGFKSEGNAESTHRIDTSMYS